MIRGLKAVALRQFKEAAADSLDIHDFVQATQAVYTQTVENDSLRDVVEETLYNSSRWLEKEEVRDFPTGLGALTYDSVIYMGQHSRSPARQ